MDTELLEATPAARELNRLQQAAKKLPELERQAENERQRTLAEEQEEILKTQFSSALADYNAGLEIRNKAIEELYQLLLGIIKQGKKCDLLASNLMNVAQQVAHVQLIIHPSVLGLSKSVIEGQSVDLLRANGAYPLGVVGLDDNEKTQILMLVLRKFARFMTLPPKPLLPVKYKMADGQGNWVETY